MKQHTGKDGTVWIIQKASTSYGNWAARDANNANKQVFAFTLAKLIDKLRATD